MAGALSEPEEDKPVLFIVHWNRPELCAATARRFAEDAAVRLVILDNGSTPQNIERLMLEVATLADFIPLGANHGWGGALNRVLAPWIEQPGGNYCLISAHDAAPHAGCVSKLLAALESNPRLGIVCPEYPDQSVARLSLWHGVQQIVPAKDPCKVIREVDVPHGTLMALRKTCLREIGLFDERFFAYGDEHELGLRARRHGWKVAIICGAIVENPETSSSADWREYLFARNSLLLAKADRGSFGACLRALVLLCNCLRRPGQRGAISNRMRGIRDYFAGHYGSPAE